MVFSVSPSVTVREVDLTSNIPAIASNQGAIAGVFNWGPVGEVTLVTSESELVSMFGEPSANNYETFFTAADFLSYSNRLYVVRANNGAVAAESSTLSGVGAKYPGAIGNSIEISIVSSNTSGTDAYAKNIFAATQMFPSAAPGETNLFFGKNTISFEANTNVSVEFKAGDSVRLGNDTVGYQVLNLTENPTVTELVPNTSFRYAMTFDTNFLLSSSSLSDFSLERLWGYSGIVGKAPEAGNLHAVVIDATGDITGTAGTVLERYTDLSLTEGTTLDDGTNNYYKDVINTSSAWVKIDDDATAFGAGTRTYSTFSGGTNGSSESSATFGNLAAAYDLFRNAEEFDIAFILQGKAKEDTNLANYIIGNICDVRKDCVLFLSPSRTKLFGSDTGATVLSNKSQIVSNLISFRNALQSSSYWFMDSGYKYRYDKYNDKYRWVPLNGDVAGLAARIQPWESPAGYKRGIVKNVVKLAFNPNKAQRDELYGKDINSVISQAGQGTLLFGDKTGLGRSSAFDRINVRRLFIVVEKAIATASASLLFDFNDEFTQTEFRNIVEPFLRDIKGRRGITDFRVISDARVNTPDVVDRNIFRANIFIKPARTINFIELTFIATRTGISFEEIVGQQF